MSGNTMVPKALMKQRSAQGKQRESQKQTPMGGGTLRVLSANGLELSGPWSPGAGAELPPPLTPTSSPALPISLVQI